jgi:TonB family protein
MRRSVLILAAVVVLLMTALASAQSTSASTNSERKVAARVAPVYPELAKKMHIRGIVKVEAIVRPNGSVKSTRVLGGNPVLVDAAQDAVGKWKFEPTQGETTEVIQISFEGQ